MKLNDTRSPTLPHPALDRADAGERESASYPEPEFTPSARAALLWVLWHHQGGSSKVGQPIRFALGMGQHDRLAAHQIAEARLWAELTGTAALPAADPERREGAEGVGTSGGGEQCR